ncbi:MAG TPA: nickel-binding protein [Actinomycetota bacterium]|nr:nickel-binding protein [Actinomycetota bacterium]
MYLDRHNLDGATPEDVAAAHQLDLDLQGKHDVRFLSYWFDYQRQQGFCLVEAPNPAAAVSVHRESHGLIPLDIIEVQQGQVEEFLGAPPHFAAGEAYEASAFRTILFTDIVGSTALTQRLGDAGAMNVLRQHDEAVRGALREWSGREIKHTGDGIMASFTSASRGVGCALAIQERFVKLATSDVDPPIQVRIGIAAGEPVTEKGDLFGTAVQLAARLCASADPGGTLVSHAVRELCAGKELEFDLARDLELRGFAETVRAYATVPKRGATNA